MNMKMVWIFEILLALVVVHVGARVEFMPMSWSYLDHLKCMSTDFQCGSCLEASRSAEKTLNNLKMFEEVSMLSKKVCQALPVDLEIKCLKKSGDYIQYTQSMFQELFHEESLCNNTRLCTNENRVHSNGFLTDKESGGGSCSKCRQTVGKLILELKDPRMKTKVTNAMLNFCEEKDENHQKCDETIYQYGAVVLDKLEHAKSKDLCKALDICGGGGGGGGGDDDDDDDDLSMAIKIKMRHN